MALSTLAFLSLTVGPLATILPSAANLNLALSAIASLTILCTPSTNPSPLPCLVMTLLTCSVIVLDLPVAIPVFVSLSVVEL